MQLPTEGGATGFGDLHPLQDSGESLVIIVSEGTEKSLRDKKDSEVIFASSGDINQLIATPS